MSDPDFIQRLCEAHYWHEHAQRDQIVARNNFVATSIALVAALAYGLHALPAPDVGRVGTEIVFAIVQLFVLGSGALLGLAVYHVARSAAPIKDERHYEYVLGLNDFSKWEAELVASNPGNEAEARQYAAQSVLEQLNAASAQNQETNKQRLIDSVKATRHAAHASLCLVFGGAVFAGATLVSRGLSYLNS